jgi:hypothetical protein
VKNNIPSPKDIGCKLGNFNLNCSSLTGQNCFEALFTSRVFKGIGGNYFVSQNFPGRLFTRSGFEGIIPGYSHKSPPH